jgi:undecaprenyl-diphosphatase
VVRDEAVLLSLALVVVGGVWVFVEIADEVAEGSTITFDQAVLRLLRRPADPSRAIGPGWLFEVARDITALGSTSVLLLVLLAVLEYLRLARRRHELWLVFFAAVGGAALSTGLKAFFARPRPSLFPPLVPVSSPSFPSGHAMLAAVVYLTLGALLARLVARRRMKAHILGAAMFLTFLVGLTRVYLGVHYPSDVLAGWAAGLVWATGCWLVARHLQRRGVVAAPGESR